MDTRQVEYALAVADERNFTRAAQRVFASQSTVSVGVRALERELGAALFERDSRGVRVTSAGEAVLPALREFIAAAERARIAADPSGELRGELRIGIFSNLNELQLIDLPGILGDFHREHPLVDLRLRPSPTGSTGLVEEVRLGRADLALYGLAGDPGQGLRAHRISRGRFVAVLPPHHRLAERDSLRLSDLAGERFVDTPAGFGNRVMLDAAFAAAGLARVIATEIAEVGSIPRFVVAGLGVAVIPRNLFDDGDGNGKGAGIVVVPIEPRLDWDLSVIARAEPNAVVRAFLDRLLLAVPH